MMGLKTGLTTRECERLADHFERQLEALGLDWYPRDLPSQGGIDIIAQADWSRVNPAENLKALVRVEVLPLDSHTWSLGFRAVVLCALPNPYSDLFRCAIHEAAHILLWYERMRTTGNRFTPKDIRAFEKSKDHGKRFKLLDSKLLHRAMDLGFRGRGMVPDEVADLFEEKARHRGNGHQWGPPSRAQVVQVRSHRGNLCTLGRCGQGIWPTRDRTLF